MKASTLHSLITAKSIFNEAKPLIASGNAYSCSAGLILLQDALELIVLALLGERGVDEKNHLESKGFDELIGELKKEGVKIPKSGTIKALNKQRVITKHYGQLAEPATVRNYFESATIFIQAILGQVIGKTLNEVLLTDLLPNCEAKDCLIQAILEKDSGNFLECLIEIRKALFVEYELGYAIHGWLDVETTLDAESAWLSLIKGGGKAPYWKRNKKWIVDNVKKPCDYIQIDHEQLRLDAMEWGVNTAELENLRRLTPDVFRAAGDTGWCIEYQLHFPSNEATLSNCNECLDSAISIILKKKQHENSRRWPRNEQPYRAPTIYVGHAVFKAATTQSEVVHVVNEQYLYSMQRQVSGFDPNETYYYLSGNEPPDNDHPYGNNHIFGYLLKVE